MVTAVSAKASPLSVLPGIAAAAAIAISARFGSDWLGVAILNAGKSPISPIMLAVVAGILIRSTVGVAPGLERGIAVAASAVLRVGLALVGLRLTLLGLGSLGLKALPVVAGCLVVAWLVIPRLARAFGLTGSLVTLLTVGTSVCGCTAIMAVAPIIRARVEETGYAVTIVVIVGLAGMLLYPGFAHLLFAADPLAAGIFLGTSIHDTSQVMGAALLYSGQYQAPEALDAATVSKLMRNLTLVAVVPALALMQSRNVAANDAAGRTLPATRVPGFVVAFVALAGVRSLGDTFSGGVPGFAAQVWTPGLAVANQVSELLLTIGMAAVGLTVELRQLRNVGWRPLAAGVAAALMMALVSLSLVLAIR